MSIRSNLIKYTPDHLHEYNSNSNSNLHKRHKPRPRFITDNLKKTTLLLTFFLLPRPPHPEILPKGKQLLHTGRPVLQPRRTLPHALCWNPGDRHHGEDEREARVLEFCGRAGEGEEFGSSGEDFGCEGWCVFGVAVVVTVVLVLWWFGGGEADVVD